MALSSAQIEQRLSEIAKQIGQLSQSVIALESNTASARIDVIAANMDSRMEIMSKQIAQLTQVISNMSAAEDSANKIEVIKEGLDAKITVLSMQVGGLSQTVSTLGDMSRSTYDINANGVVDLAEGVFDGTYDATAQQISLTVDSKHDRHKDLYLDRGGVYEVSAQEIRLSIDSALSTFLELTDVIPTTFTGSANKNVTVNAAGTGLVFSVGAGSGDMLKAIYDTDDNGTVDLAEGINDGVNSATAANLEDAVDKAHEHTLTTDIFVRWTYVVGNESTDGSIRMGMKLDDFVWELRIAGNWETAYGVGIT